MLVDPGLKVGKGAILSMSLTEPMSETLKIIAGLIGIAALLIGFWIKRANEQPYKRRHRVIDDKNRKLSDEIDEGLSNEEYVKLSIMLDDLHRSNVKLRKEKNHKVSK